MKYKIKTIGLFTLLVLSSLKTFSDNIPKFDVKFQVETNVPRDSVKKVLTIVTDLDGRFYLDSLLYNRWDYKQMDDSLKSLYFRVVNIDTTFHNFKSSYDVEISKETFVKTQSWVRILLFVLVGMVLGLMVYLFIFLHNKMDDESKRIDQRIERRKKDIENLYEKIDSSTTGVHDQNEKAAEKMVVDLKKKNDELWNKVVELEGMLKEKNASFSIEPVTNTTQQSPSKSNESQKLFYADSIIDGVFFRVREHENDDAVFVLKLKSESKAAITLYERAYNKILENASYLDGCEKQIIGKNSVEIVDEGEAEMGSDGKWKVVTPLKVEIR